MRNKLIRNILTIKEPNKLSSSDYFLYTPYINIVHKLYKYIN